MTVRPDTYFKAGTEVYSYESTPPEHLARITLDEWLDWTSNNPQNPCLVRGLRVPRYDNEKSIFGFDEYWDGELCMTDEFDVEIVDELYSNLS